jgi:hypothetical protein
MDIIIVVQFGSMWLIRPGGVNLIQIDFDSP